MVDKVLVNVIQEAYINGVSIRMLNNKLVEDLGLKIDKSAVSRLCKELGDGVNAFRNRLCTGEYPYVWLDATFPKVREGGRVQSMAFVVAITVNDDGTREVLGFDIGMSETGDFWTDFLRSLVERGLKGMKLVISGSHTWLKNEISTVLPSATWQHCRMHCVPNILCHVSRKQQGMVVAMVVHTIFVQESLDDAKKQGV